MDITLGETRYFKFTTRAFATGVPTALVGGVISAYPNGSTTQLTAGITLTADFDGVVGLNSIALVATGGNGYAAGDYNLVVTTGTVGGVSVIGEVVGTLSIDASAALKAVDLLNDFDPANDDVAVVTLTNTTTTNTDMRGTDSANTVVPPSVAQFNARTILSAAYFDPAADTVANVTLVATTTTNTDMRGTDSANTVVPPSVSQFNARTILSAAYFDPAADAVANVTLTATTTDVTNAVTANATQIGGSTSAATQLALSTNTIVSAAAITGTLSTTEMTTNLTETTDDHYNGRVIIWTSGVLKDQATDITDYTGSTKLLTYTAVTEAPSNTDTFIIV